ncbi:MAG: glycosyltransferase family 9 protein [Candidatus Riflebacteria bacterium]
MITREILLRLNAMGDILLTVPCLRELEKSGIETHLVINRRWHELARFLPARVHFFDHPTDLLRLALTLNRLDAGALHDLQGKLATIALKLMVRTPKQTCYQKRSLSEQLQVLRGNFPLRFADQRPVWQKYAETCGRNIEKPDPTIVLTPDFIERSKIDLAGLNLAPHGFFALHADASHPGKVLPESLLRQICRQSPLPIALIGTGKMPINGLAGLTDLRNAISLEQLAGLLYWSAGVISSDSGPMHLARAVDAKVAGIFLQTSPVLGFSPVPGPKVLVISKDLDCKPCSLHGQRAVCPLQHFACRDLEPESTTAAIFNFFGKQP